MEKKEGEKEEQEEDNNNDFDHDNKTIEKRSVPSYHVRSHLNAIF